MRKPLFTAITMGLSLCFANAATEKTIHSFQAIDNVFLGGVTPWASVIADASGNLYGTTSLGGLYGLGVIFRLSSNSSGSWTETVLHNFRLEYSPLGDLVFDSAGNLYGTVLGGGAQHRGSVFQLSPNADGTWTYRTIFSFSRNADIRGGLTLDPSGSIYGTTLEGGAVGKGSVFRLSPDVGGGWKYVEIYSFGSSATDGVSPEEPFLTLDSVGNLYGTTLYGGLYGFGTVFELSPTTKGPWHETILYNFSGGSDGYAPASAVTFDSQGNLFGTTEAASDGAGVLYELSPDGNGGWSQTVLHTFGDGAGNGPVHLKLVFDSTGSLYGTCEGGGKGWGSVWVASPMSGGRGWGVRDLHSFQGGKDGRDPFGGVIIGPNGKLYGMTMRGGLLDGGVVFEVTQ